ncbi:MAG: hypothetical protein HYZ28_03615 [Myxococcales bacterium]|nr:hypothetical protein [Myxococcales bacterium]
MPRIAKANVNRVLENAARTILGASGGDGRVSRAEVKKALSHLQGTEKRLVDIFFRFIDHRDFKAGAQVTKRDIERAVAYAKEHMIAKYDLNRNGLSHSEVKKMSLTGKLAVDLARLLKGAAIQPPDAGPRAGETYGDFIDRMKVESQRTYTTSRGIDATLEKQIIAACHESSYDDVRTLKDAFEAVDQGEIMVRRLRDPFSGARFVMVDFGAGDNTYGAIFEEGKTKRAAGIHDGDLEL